jgi:hypothetical protein
VGLAGRPEPGKEATCAHQDVAYLIPIAFIGAIGAVWHSAHQGLLAQGRTTFAS